MDEKTPRRKTTMKHLHATLRPVASVFLSTTLLLPAAACGSGGGEQASPDPSPRTGIWSAPEVRELTGGRDQRIAVLDSGLAADYAQTCPECRATVKGEPRDEHGHGTSMAAILSGVPGLGFPGLAPDADVTVVPLAPGQEDLIRNERVVAAIDQAVVEGYDIISISLGVQTPDPVLAASIGAAIDSGVVVVAAAGPDPSDVVLYPAAFPGVLAATGDASEDGHDHEGAATDEDAGGHHVDEAATRRSSPRFPTVTVPLSALALPAYDPANGSFSLGREEHSSAAAAMLAGLVAGHRSATRECADMTDLATYLSRIMENGADGRPLLDDVAPECTGQGN